MKYVLTLIHDQYPDEPRPVQIQGTRFCLGESGETPTPLVLEHASAAIAYFQGRAVNRPSGYTFMLTPI